MLWQYCGSVSQSVGFGSVSCQVSRVWVSVLPLPFINTIYILLYDFSLIIHMLFLHRDHWLLELGGISSAKSLPYDITNALEWDFFNARGFWMFLVLKNWFEIFQRQFYVIYKKLNDAVEVKLFYQSFRFNSMSTGLLGAFITYMRVQVKIYEPN